MAIDGISWKFILLHWEIEKEKPIGARYTRVERSLQHTLIRTDVDLTTSVQDDGLLPRHKFASSPMLIVLVVLNSLGRMDSASCEFDFKSIFPLRVSSFQGLYCRFYRRQCSEISQRSVQIRQSKHARSSSSGIMEHSDPLPTTKGKLSNQSVNSIATMRWKISLEFANPFATFQLKSIICQHNLVGLFFPTSVIDASLGRNLFYDKWCASSI